jgi:16S rRNA (cytosine1402-N4)-methyltransferase
VLAPFAPMNRRALTASEDEIAANPRARSAKLRIATRTEHPAP